MTGEKIGMIMRRMKMVSKEDLIRGLKIQKVKKAGKIGQILIKMGVLDQEQLKVALAIQAGTEFVDLGGITPDQSLLEKITVKMAKTYNVFPVKEENETVYVAMVDTDNYDALDNLRFLLGTTVEPMLCSKESLDKAIEDHYASDEADINELLDFGDEDDMLDDDGYGLPDSAGETTDISAAANDVNSAPVIKLLNYYLRNAIDGNAADIHFEPFEDSYKVRMRVDGALIELEAPPRHLAPALSARVKVMASMDIAETRLPQDNRISLTIGGRGVDLRVSTLPTKFGESVVLRVLDRTVVSLDIEQIGMSEDLLAHFRKLIKLPNGIILVTGPTGSGKTTTLYAALNDVNSVEDKIITTEDPVEYDLDGIMQVQVASDIGLTFAACLRSILRQDPDKILVGEIRDLETARIAVDAALTGHLVFSTLHTNSSSLTIARLVDMGIEPYSVAATVVAIMAQRLVRKICRDCKEEYTPTSEILFKLGLNEEDVGGRKFYAGKGCDTCHGTGYRGRTAIYELMELNDEIREMILEKKSAQEINDAALKAGMTNLRASGIHLIFDGLTTIEEVLQVTV